jgi:hypothetical protein
MNNILFVSHKKSQCGVYEFGKSITDILQYSKKYQFIRVECSSLDELHSEINKNSPIAIIYNYMPSVLPWVATRIIPKMLYKSNITDINIPQIGIIHEITQTVADEATNRKYQFIVGKKLINSVFDYYIAPDPTLLLKNDIVFKTGRLVPSYQNKFTVPLKPTIGSFGFGTHWKGFEEIVQLVQQEFDDAIIRFNIPSADFADKNGNSAKNIAEECKALITKPNIKLVITHGYMDKKTMLDFLAQNTINVFLYKSNNNRGVSSTLDNALAVQRPIAVSDVVMFRHVLDIRPSICVSQNSLKEIIQNGFTPLQKRYSEWSPANLLWEYERILDKILARQQKVTWINSTSQVKDDMSVVSIQYQPILVNISLNRILDNKARELYKPAIDTLMKLLPRTMAKKIPAANVQQAFVFDTVCRYLPKYKNPKILCVGSYEDTASMGLTKMGVDIEEIDPMINYSLQEYITKPTTVKGSYDIIFSTSVIEHDADDESFIKCIAELLAPNGMAIITCDYKDGWKQGEPKPECDARLYTQYDLKYRLLPLMKGCHLVDKPQWECINPDFTYLRKYKYTFATIVVKKEDKKRMVEG